MSTTSVNIERQGMETTPAEVSSRDDKISIQEQAEKLYDSGIKLLGSKKKCIDKVIKCLQKAISLDDTKYTYWQLLGEAYYQRGSLTPAVNCFTKSLQLAEDSDVKDEDQIKTRQQNCTHARLRMSDVRFILGQLDEAALGYDDIISKEPDNVDALLGLCKTELQLCKRDFSSGIVKSGHSHCMQALKLALRAAKISPNLSLVWKLAFHCCMTQFVDGHRGHFSTDIGETFSDSFGNTTSVLDRRACIELAQQFLFKAIAIEQSGKSAPLWHNLGLCLYMRSTTEQPASKEHTSLLKRSLRCLVKALSYDRQNSQIKNSIGVIAFNLKLLSAAQTFLINSIQTNQSTSEVQFSNLGYALLSNCELMKAGSVFLRSQAEDPRYCGSWLGAAIINETLSLDSLSYLRHGQRLGSNYQAQLMFAVKVAGLPLNELTKRDYVSALECMRKVLNYDEQSIIAMNTLGLILEKLDHIDEAIMCFESAYKMSPKDPKVIFNKLRYHLADKSCCLIGANFQQNLEYDLVQDAERLSGSGNPEFMLNFLYYLFKNEDFRDLTSKLTKFCDKSLQNEIRGRVCARIILGLAAKQNKGDFKGLFIKNTIESESLNSIESVINLSCLMILCSGSRNQTSLDSIATKLSENMMNFITNNPVNSERLLHEREGFWIRFTLFCSLFCLEDRGKLLRPILAMFPMIAEFWLFLAFNMILDKAKVETIMYCLRRASLIGSSNANICLVCDLLLSDLANGDPHTRSKHLAKAIFKFPEEKLLWNLLLANEGANKNITSQRRDQKQNLGNTLFDLALTQTLEKVVS